MHWHADAQSVVRTTSNAERRWQVGQPITFAGLWSSWNDREAGNKLLSCTMVITEPNKFVAEMHDRMPVILEAKNFEQWEQGDAKDAGALMKPAGEDVLQKWLVSKRVNSSRAPDDDASLIEAIDGDAKVRRAI